MSLEHIESIHKALVDSVRDYAIIALDRTGTILTWNDGAEIMSGYTAAEVIGKHFSVVYTKEAIAEGRAENELRIAAEHGRYEEEGWRVRKDGTHFWASVVINTLFDETRAVVGFAKITRDLTERKLAEAALQRSEERFRLLVQSVSDYGIFMLDPTGHVASWNAGARRIKGYEEKEILGQHFSKFYPESDRISDKPGMELRVASQTGRFEDEGWRVHKDGTQFWANVVITALRSDSGELIGFAKVTRDLTERRAAELKAIEDARRIADAEAANRAKAEFLAAMSHELRTPLNAIGGYTDLLALGIHGVISEQQAAALERIRLSQQHLLGLISDLLNFSKLEAGHITYDLVPVQLSDTVSAVRPMIEQQAAARKITIHWPPDDISIVAVADRPRVEQILLNLLTNAVKFSREGGRIDVRHASNGKTASLGVTDSGMGIPLDKIDAIFEPFVQVGRSLTSAHEGTGLGLAISRDLARAMGGNVTVTSALGSGSDFVLTLPAHSSED